MTVVPKSVLMPWLGQSSIMRICGSQIVIRCYHLYAKFASFVCYFWLLPCIEMPRAWQRGQEMLLQAPVKTGLYVIRHAVKDPADLRSNCAPVGPSEPRLSLHRSATGSHPRAGLRKPEGGPGSGFAMAGCPLRPPSSLYSSIHTHWHVYTRSERKRERSVCVSVLEHWVLTSAQMLHWTAERQ